MIGAEGDAAAVAGANDAAWQRFETVLAELVSELPLLRMPVDATHADTSLQGSVARTMWQACRPFAGPFAAGFITPMAAVAGAVADAVIAAYRRPGIRRAWVNNGGDIALHLQPGEVLRVGLVADLSAALRQVAPGVIAPDGRFDLHAQVPVRGLATSGWRGRSFSLGIADSVTVLARTAAEADAAATVIANAVNSDDPRIVRRPACELKDDSDMGAIPVTALVPVLPASVVRAALHAGWQRAQALRAQGLVWHVALVCQGQLRTTLGDTAETSELDFPINQNRAVGSVFA